MTSYVNPTESDKFNGLLVLGVRIDGNSHLQATISDGSSSINIMQSQGYCAPILIPQDTSLFSHTDDRLVISLSLPSSGSGDTQLVGTFSLYMRGDRLYVNDQTTDTHIFTGSTYTVLTIKQFAPLLQGSPMYVKYDVSLEQTDPSDEPSLVAMLPTNIIDLIISFYEVPRQTLIDRLAAEHDAICGTCTSNAQRRQHIQRVLMNMRQDIRVHPDELRRLLEALRWDYSVHF